MLPTRDSPGASPERSGPEKQTLLLIEDSFTARQRRASPETNEQESSE